MAKTILNSIDEIKRTVNAGIPVYCDNEAYTVIKDFLGQYFIKAMPNGHCVGLHGQEGTEYENRLNGTEFYCNSEDFVYTDAHRSTAEQFAFKFIAEGALDTSDESLATVFKRCVLPATRFLYPLIREYITANWQPAWVRIERAGGNTVEITEEEHWEALEVMPPIYLYDRNTSAFAMMEAHHHDNEDTPVYFCFTKQADKYFGCLATTVEARDKFKADLRRVS